MTRQDCGGEEVKVSHILSEMLLIIRVTSSFNMFCYN